jgi:hypothetical protein
VEGVLRLSGARPVSCSRRLGSDEITLDVAIGLCGDADRERLVWVFEQLRGSYSAAHPTAYGAC